MKSLIQKEKKAKQKQQAQLLQELIPIAKSFALWFLLVVVTVLDYNYLHYFTQWIILANALIIKFIAIICFIPVSLHPLEYGTVASLSGVAFQRIIINRYSMIIELECTAYHAYFAIFSLVIFASWQWKKKMKVFSIIFVILLIFNILRQLTLGIIGRYYPQVFGLLHDYVWNILILILVWLLWEWQSNKVKQSLSSVL